MSKVAYKKIEVDFNTEAVVPIVFGATSKISAVYVYFKNEFTTEQEIELYSVFGESDSHKGTEIYDKCKKRFTLKTDNVFFRRETGSESQRLFMRISNSDALDNTVYITVAYSAE